MKLQLKKLRIYTSMSEETLCFETDVYVDGKKVAYAKDDGRGGEVELRENDKWDDSMLTGAANRLREIDPDDLWKDSTDYNGFIELIKVLTYDHLELKDYQKHYRTHVAYLNDDQILTVPKKYSEAEFLQHIESKYKDQYYFSSAMGKPFEALVATRKQQGKTAPFDRELTY